MPLLKDREWVEDDHWSVLDEALLEADLPLEISAYTVLPYEQFIEGVPFSEVDGPVGVKVTPDIELDSLVSLSQQTEFILIEFPVFTDGRGFSLARKLRALGYRGELRAAGAISRDRLAFMERCGFNSVELPSEESTDPHLAYSEISAVYQSSADRRKAVYHQ